MITEKTPSKNLILKLLVCLMALISTAGVTSCVSDDDEEEATYPSELLGIWDGVTRQITVTDADGNTLEDTETPISTFRYSINTNGTIVGYERAAGKDWREISRGFWAYGDGRLLVSERSGDKLYVVLTLEYDRLVISSTAKVLDENDEETGSTRVTTDSFRRAM